jgi:hypothetical protein
MMNTGFRQPAAGLALAVGIAWALATPASGAPSPGPAAEKVSVELDRATLMKLPEHVETIVVGNPIIADVTMLKRNGLVVITGKGFGQTNVIFLDSSGQKESELLVSVQEARGLLTVQRGLDRESYSCQPRCEPTIALGDATKFLSEASGQISSRNGLASPGGH